MMLPSHPFKARDGQIRYTGPASGKPSIKAVKYFSSINAKSFCTKVLYQGKCNASDDNGVVLVVMKLRCRFVQSEMPECSMTNGLRERGIYAVAKRQLKLY